MTALQRTIVCFSLIMGSFWFFMPLRRPDMTIVYPDNCVFVIDHFFSHAMQLEIKSFIDAAYKKSKSPSNLLPKIESHFPAIKSVVIDMQNPALLNFTIQSYQPLFLINDEHVICQGGKMFTKNTFAIEQISKLENIHFEDVPTPENVDRLMQFFETIADASNSSLVKSYPIFKDFSVRWIDKHVIWLDQKEILGSDHKQRQDLSLLIGYTTIPSDHDIAQCRNLRGQIVDRPCNNKRGQPCKNNTTWVCDLRFDRQIVLFSTNKGV